MMRTPIRLDAVAMAEMLKRRGIDVPDADDDAGAEAHFGAGLTEGCRYLRAGDLRKLMVYDGTKWIQQATCN